MIINHRDLMRLLVRTSVEICLPVLFTSFKTNRKARHKSGTYSSLFMVILRTNLLHTDRLNLTRCDGAWSAYASGKCETKVRRRIQIIFQRWCENINSLPFRDAKNFGITP